MPSHMIGGWCDIRDTSLTISSFGEGGTGELYVLDRGGGRMYAIVQG